MPFRQKSSDEPDRRGFMGKDPDRPFPSPDSFLESLVVVGNHPSTPDRPGACKPSSIASRQASFSLSPGNSPGISRCPSRAIPVEIRAATNTTLSALRTRIIRASRPVDRALTVDFENRVPRNSSVIADTGGTVPGRNSRPGFAVPEAPAFPPVSTAAVFDSRSDSPHGPPSVHRGGAP